MQRRDDRASDVVLEATRRGMVDVLRALVDEGADVNKADHDGETLLHMPLQ